MSRADLIVGILVWTALFFGGWLVFGGFIGMGFGGGEDSRFVLWLGGGLIVAAVLTAIGRSRPGSTGE